MHFGLADNIPFPQTRPINATSEFDRSCSDAANTFSGPRSEIGKSGFVDSGGVKFHYVTAGEGPLLVMLHGFPDYHYTWRDQIPA